MPVTPHSTYSGAHEILTNSHDDWVSATQTTNGVAGDTIQKGEVLTLRFFEENILGDVNPNAPGGGTEKSTRPRQLMASPSSSTVSATPKTWS